MKMKCPGILLLCFAILNSRDAFSQAKDSLSSSSTSDGALQFQLIGGLGVYYIGECGTYSHFRIGADLSLNHSDQSGSGTSYYYNTPSSTSSSTTVSQPEQSSTSYQFSLSALYLQKLVEYRHASMYCGIGPSVNYSWNRSTNKSPSTETSGGTVIYSSTDSYGSTEKTSGIGPLVILGVRSRLVEHVGLSAEIGVSAVYWWNTQTYFSNSTSSGTSSDVSTANTSSTSRLTGWAISLTGIRVGLIVEL